MSSLNVPVAVLEHASHKHLVAMHDQAANWRSQEGTLEDREMTDALLADLAEAATKAGDKSFGRMVSAIQSARTGDFTKSVPKLAAAPQMIREYLIQHKVDGWVYRREADGHLHPYLVTEVRIESSRNLDSPPLLQVRLAATGEVSRGRRSASDGIYRTSVSLEPDRVTRKKVPDILAAMSLYVETADLREDYDRATERFHQVLTTGFTQQYRFTGQALSTEDYRADPVRTDKRVVNDLEPSEVLIGQQARSQVFTTSDDEEWYGEVPIRPLIRVFDLTTHDYLWVNSRDLTDYAYDASLREKLVLPASHRELLDILTHDIATFTGDIVEGKSAGNVILAKGVPGVGKTLSAEVYSELIERPLYSIHSGSLGTSADSIRKALETVFKRATRWNAVLLLDEADVFVIARGANIQQNAIVAEFLRTLEYFDGLMFMTTNRANDIDEAILSRCAAIIDYALPSPKDAARIWRVMATNFGADLDDALIAELVEGFAHIAPRDIKMLMRLALRVSAHRDEPLSEDLFARCAMFRGLHYDWREDR
jgi:hypothetical protein